jgi:hypothetical protein
MANEYTDLRTFQYQEIEPFIKVKATKEPEFKKMVDEAHARGVAPARPILTGRRDSNASSAAMNSPVVPYSASPVLYQSPVDAPDINHLRNDASLPPFIKFFLHLQVVQHNWLAISRGWMQYVTFFQRKLLTERAFAKAILEDAVRTTNKAKFIPDPERIEEIRKAAQNMSDNMPISRIVAETLLELAESGDVEFSLASNESKGETFGPKILLDVMSTEALLRARQDTTTPMQIEKATDPRQR